MNMDKSTIKIYRNKRNKHKYLEVHIDGHFHYSVRQFMKWDNGVINYTGDGKLHRWRKANLMELLADYSLVNE